MNRRPIDGPSPELVPSILTRCSPSRSLQSTISHHIRGPIALSTRRQSGDVSTSPAEDTTCARKKPMGKASSSANPKSQIPRCAVVEINKVGLNLLALPTRGKKLEQTYCPRKLKILTHSCIPYRYDMASLISVPSQACRGVAARAKPGAPDPWRRIIIGTNAKTYQIWNYFPRLGLEPTRERVGSVEDKEANARANPQLLWRKRRGGSKPG